MVTRAFPASRAYALRRLTDFLPHAAHAYAAGRNTDPGPDRPGAVSKLSPYLRYRLITEQEVVAQVLARHDLRHSDKFVQEVLWRTYWKGWLEMRPSVWQRFLDERDRQSDVFCGRDALGAAEQGRTGIEGFDDWARELVETGYLHNHARMWFASIWIFTLRLPWVLGADFFLRHLLDADAASNTLSWRWVAGLQTAGKTYLATSENIERYTNGRFRPTGLAQEAVALSEEALSATKPLPALSPYDRDKPSLLLVTHEDMNPESLSLAQAGVKAALIANDRNLLWGEGARDFVASACQDAADRVAAHFQCRTGIVEGLNVDQLVDAALSANVRQIITAVAPVGPVADKVAEIIPALAAAGISLVAIRRDWDSIFWPHAKKGFFPFKTQIPDLLREIAPA